MPAKPSEEFQIRVWFRRIREWHSWTVPASIHGFKPIKVIVLTHELCFSCSSSSNVIITFIDSITPCGQTLDVVAELSGIGDW